MSTVSNSFQFELIRHTGSMAPFQMNHDDIDNYGTVKFDFQVRVRQMSTFGRKNLTRTLDNVAEAAQFDIRYR